MDAWIIIEAFVNFLQIFIIYKVFDLYYDRRLEYRYSIEIVIIIMTIILTLLNYYFKIQSNPILYIAFYLLIFITTAIIFKGNIFSKAVMLFLILAAIGTFEVLSVALVTTISGFDLKTIQEQNNVRLVVMIISQTILIFSYMFIKNKKYSRNRFYTLNIKYNLLIGFILLITIIVIVIVIWMCGNIDVSNESISISLLALTLCVSLFSITSITLTSQILIDLEEKHKNEMELQQIKLERAYLEDVNLALEEIRIIRHDMRGELALIHGYNELNQKDKISAHIEKKLQEMDVQLIPQIDNENIITSFLNFKIKEAESKNINVELTSNINDEEIYIDKEDICRIINNIMNNVIEALEEFDAKKAKLFIGIVDDYFIIKSENAYKGKLLTEGEKILTLKRDKAKHGYGLKSINSIAEKYNGFMSIIYEENKFKIDVEMKNKIHKNAAVK